MKSSPSRTSEATDTPRIFAIRGKRVMLDMHLASLRSGNQAPKPAGAAEPGAFVAMREAIANTKEFSKRLDELEQRLEKRLTGHDHAIAELLSAIRALMNPPLGNRRPIGFVRSDDD